MEGEAQRWLGDEEKSRLAFERARDLGLERLRERPNDPLYRVNWLKRMLGYIRKKKQCP